MTFSNMTSAIEAALAEHEIIESVRAEMAKSRANRFSGAAVVQNAGVAVIEYAEKHFNGPSMADDEWASI